MAGLLGNGWDDPQSAAIMALAGGLLQGNFGGGLLGANAAFQEHGDRRIKRSLQEAQMQETLAQAQERQEALRRQRGLSELASQFYNPAQQAQGGTADVNAALSPELRIGAQAPIPGRAPGFDVRGYTDAAMGRNLMDPLEAIKLQKAMAPESQINKLDVKDFTPASVAKFARSQNYADLERLDKLHFADTGGAVQGLNPFTGRPVGGVPKSGDPFKDLVLGDGNGGLRPNAPLIGAKSQIAKSGASNITVNTEKSLLNEVAGGVGKSMTTARDNASAALGTINTVNRLMDAIDSGKVMAGPTTTFRQAGLQLGGMLGISGKDAQETLLNTRQAVQSLAQLELDAAQQMKGQGQITEAERAIIRRAASGDIDGMTVPELRLLGGVLDRAARFKIKSYNSQTAPLRSNPNAAPIAPFLQIEEPGQRPAATGTAKFLGFE